VTQDFPKVGFGYWLTYRAGSVPVACGGRSSRNTARQRINSAPRRGSMSKIRRKHEIAGRWRKICATLPAVAMIGSGIAFAGPVPAGDARSAAVSSHSTAIVVPDTALTLRAAPAPNQPDPFTEATPKAPPGLLPVGGEPTSSVPALVLPTGTLPGSTATVALDNNGIPVRALEAYRAAASLVGAADAACHIDWALLAAIGRVESNHARFGGNHLDSAGVAQPGIIGMRLDGTNGTARIMDTDGGRLDRDPIYDRAVGPMQFIPSTWRVVGVDANRDGVKNPQDMTDAATSTAIYLCSGPGDLSRSGDLHGAIMRYNPSESYVRTVTAIADAYRHGVRALPASDLPAANSAPTTSDVAQVALIPRAPVLPKPVPAPPVHAKPLPVPPVHAKPVPVPPVHAKPVPAPQVPAPPVPTVAVPEPRVLVVVATARTEGVVADEVTDGDAAVER
jgi:Transglycosylase SLT domain